MIYLLESSTAVTAPIFNINNPASTGGRIDVVFRSLMASMPEELNKRKNIDFYVLLNGPPSPPLLLKFIGKKFYMHFISERKVGLLFKEILSGKKVEGVIVEKKSFSKIIDELRKDKYTIFLLDEKGTDILKLKNKIIQAFPRAVFILGDHDGLSLDALRFIEKIGAVKVSIGPKVYLTSHCILFMNFILSKWRLL